MAPAHRRHAGPTQAAQAIGSRAYSFIPVDGLAHRLGHHLFDPGDLGVSFFFVLSGFVLAWAVRGDGRPGLGRFWTGRIMRIYPAYVVALALLLTTALLGEASYAFFLVHLTVLTVGMQFFGREHPYPPLVALLLAVGFLVLAYALAFALHRWVEVPVLRQSPGARVHRRTATRVERAGDPVEGPLTRPG